jgi:pyruvate formate lyase activating enzyme
MLTQGRGLCFDWAEDGNTAGVEVGQGSFMPREPEMEPGLREAILYEPGPRGRLVCNLCAHRCKIGAGKAGICGVRENRGGKLYTLVYGLVIAGHVDPIEKKPLFHFAPGSTSMSIATPGCNFHCSFCQNWTISQATKGAGVVLRASSEAISPGELVKLSKRQGCASISYTYTEPTIFFEYALETAELASANGLKNVFVTNGYMTPEALDAIHPHLHAANVDLKAFRDRTYRRLIGGKLEPVLESIRKMKAQGVWLEVTTLVVPTVNDSDGELRDIAQFIKSVGPEIPWHISAFFPNHKLMNLPSTPVETLVRAMEIGKESGLRYVYAGNVPGHEGEHTLCYSCGTPLIKRFGFQVLENRTTNGACHKCGAQIDGFSI